MGKNIINKERLSWNFDDSVETSTSVKMVKSTKTDNSRRTVFIMDGLYQDFLDYHTIQMSLQKAKSGL